MSEDRELRDALEKAQQENKLLRGELAELRTFDPKSLLSRIAELEAEVTTLRQRLEQADLVRENWDGRVKRLKLELDIARMEQERLRSLLENERLTR